MALRNCDGYTAEITQNCILEGQPNGCSMLYGACWRAARALGYRRLITYSLSSEPGTSLTAAGFHLVGATRDGQTWSRTGRPRVDNHPLEPKMRWGKTLEPVRKLPPGTRPELPASTGKSAQSKRSP